MNKYFKKINNTDHISEWRSEGLSDEVIKPPAIHDNNLAAILTLNWVGGVILIYPLLCCFSLNNLETIKAVIHCNIE